MADLSEEDSHQTHLSRKDFQEYEEDEEEAKFQINRNLGQQVPGHRSSKKPPSILKNRKATVGGRKRAHLWQVGSEMDNDSDEEALTHQNPSLTETNFFECRDVTNCEFIYDQAEKNQQRQGLLESVGSFFKKKASTI